MFVNTNVDLKVNLVTTPLRRLIWCPISMRGSRERKTRRSGEALGGSGPTALGAYDEPLKIAKAALAKKRRAFILFLLSSKRTYLRSKVLWLYARSAALQQWYTVVKKRAKVGSASMSAMSTHGRSISDANMSHAL